MGTARGAVGGFSRYGVAMAMLSRINNVRPPYDAYRKLTVGSATPGDLTYLFRNGEAGGWYDPSDMSTLFQDIYGTIPVTGLTQPVALMLDKKSIPVQYSIFNDNLVTNGTFDSASGWMVGASWTIGSGVATRTASVSNLSTNVTFEVGKTYLLEWEQVRTSAGGEMSTFFSTSGTRFYALDNMGTTGTKIAFITPTTTETGFRFTGDATWAGYIDNVSVREVVSSSTNHLIQANAASRPTLEARINFLVQSQQFDGPAWSPSNVTVLQDIGDIAAPDGTLTAATVTANATNATLLQGYASARSNQRAFSVWLRRRTGTGTVGIQTGTGSYTTVTLTSSWQRFFLTQLVNVVGVANAGIQIATSGDAVDIWGAQVELVNGNVPPTAPQAYQRVTSATDYEDIGIPPYLNFDGADDVMNAIGLSPAGKFSAANGVTCVAGFRSFGNNNTGSPSHFTTFIITDVLGFAVANNTETDWSVNYRGNGDAQQTTIAYPNIGQLSVRSPMIIAATMQSNAPVFSRQIGASALRGFVGSMRYTALSRDSQFRGGPTTALSGIGSSGFQFWGGLLVSRAVSDRELIDCYSYLARVMRIPYSVSGADVGPANSWNYVY